MADPHAIFFGLFGLAGAAIPADKRALFLQLVSLFDSLHDFGTFGSVYDYVTKSDNKWITHKRTVFNHLRNSYSLLKDRHVISTTNSQLRCASNSFYLKASLSKAKLEDAFYNYAVTYLRPAGARPIIKLRHDAIDLNTLKTHFAIPAEVKNVVFSIDTQKKLSNLTGLIGGGDTAFLQVLDMEKVCDPASHTIDDQDNIQILTEVRDVVRNYSAEDGITGVESVSLSGFGVDGGKKITRIAINLSGSAGETLPIKMNDGASHSNNVSNVNKNLNSLLVRALNNDDNKNVEPTLEFYDNVNIKSYGELGAGNLLTLVRDIRRKLAQKRLGDQLQVLACKKVITYDRGGVGTKYRVQHPIFVSIDRMAIAFAIANGVNCIYSNGDNLTLIHGPNVPSIKTDLDAIPGKIARRPQSERKSRTQTGGATEDWEEVEEELLSSPYHIVNLFLLTGPVGGRPVRTGFRGFVGPLGFVSTKIKNDGNIDADNYVIRSFTVQPGGKKITIDNPADDCIFFGKRDANEWKIKKNGPNFELRGPNGDYTYYSLATLQGFFAAGSDSTTDISLGASQRGGESTRNKKFVQMLGQYDIYTLIDAEQMKIWYDEFYTSEDGIPFYSPTFYELNALFQELFKKQYENLDYTMLLPYLESQSKTNLYANSCFIALKRIFDYMEIDTTQQSSEIDQVTQQAFATILEASSHVSTEEYGPSLRKLQGVSLLDYIYEKDITPFYFVNKFNELYPVATPSEIKKSLSIVVSNPEVQTPFSNQGIATTPLQQTPFTNQGINTGPSRKTRRTRKRSSRKTQKTRKTRKTNKTNRHRN